MENLSANQLASQLNGLLSGGQKPSQEQLSEMLNHAKVLNSGSDQRLIKGMRELEHKTVVIDMTAKHKTWNDIGVPKEIQKGLEDLSMNKPSIIQAASIPKTIASMSQNFLFQAQNGSGKTLAFGIPALMRVDVTVPNIQVIIIANTRELIRQVQQVLAEVAKNTKITICIGETNTPKECAQIVVTVPAWVENRLKGRTPIDLSKVKLLVYDEADEIFLQEANHTKIEKMNQHFSNKLHTSPQNILFSATFNDSVVGVIQNFVSPCNVYRIKNETLKLKGVQMYRLQVDEDSKKYTINEVYLQFGNVQTMIFCNTKKSALELKEHLKNNSIEAETLIGGIDQKERDTIIDNFRKQVTMCLISTNVLARGIDVPEVDLVVNYDVPIINDCGYKHPDVANYLHRVGRTGRFGTDGLAVNLYVDETEDDLLDSIQKHYEFAIRPLKNLMDLKDILKEMGRTE